ncbi:OPT oligopeptide transporter protein-domain-containing protein [Lipomyces japonicus]|uniref:OPT oligopeptide transporter protein-domain-containing protein n=1 Tax=Lipomyces japonicus TaxID=56871 RepID=UPI0034CD4495
MSEEKIYAHKDGNTFISQQDVSSENEKIREFDRDQVVARLKDMNQLGETVDEDPLADKASAYLFEKFLLTSLGDAIQILNTSLVDHYGDVNFSQALYKKIHLIVAGSEAYGTNAEVHELDARLEAVVIRYHSPYPEVRAVTDPFDDPTVPVETIRAYVLGCLWVAIGSFINEFFNYRQPRLTLQSTVIQLFLFPCGKLTELLPDWGFTFQGTRYSINPGPWSIKEQMFATIMVNCGGQISNWLNMVIALRAKIFFGYDWVDFGFTWVINASSLFFGYGLAGMMRKMVIYPEKAIFPNVLPTLALSRALVVKETKTSINGWTIGRQKLFFLTFVLSFLYFFIPNFLFKALSTFNWMTWIAPKNVNLAIITGSYLGFGLNPIPTFDWAVINSYSPLVVPFYAFLNKFAGALISGVIMLALYYTNYKWSAYLPINSNDVFDRFGNDFNVSRVLTNGVFDHSKYVEYSPPYISAGNIVGTGALLAIYTCAFTYVMISEYKLVYSSTKMFWISIRHPRRKALLEFNDAHSNMMSKYPEVPDWWFLAIFIIFTGLCFAGIYAWPTHVPIWTIISIFLFNIAMMIPLLVVMSRTGSTNGFGAFSVILAGYMDPGNAMTNLMVRMWGYNIDEQAESFIADQKIAHYAKIPQRAAFRGQIVATFIQSFCTVGAIEALFKSVKNFCSKTQPDKFVCATPRTMHSDAIMWGVVSSERVLTSIYPAMKHAFWIGALIGVPFAIVQLKYPQRFKAINPALMGYGAIMWGGTYNLSYYIPGLYFSFLFMFYLRRYYTGWWSKYTYVLTSGLSAGVAFSGVIIFASLQYTNTSLPWWGNKIYASGVDYARTAALKKIPPEGFGLQIGQFS